MRFQAAQILEAIAKVKATSTNGKDVELYGMFCFRGGKVATFDGLSGSVTSCDLGGMEFLVTAGKFWSILENLPNPEFELTQVEGWIHISSGRFSTKLPTQPHYDFPEIMPKDSNVYCKAGNIVQAIKSVSFTADKDDSRQNAGVGFRGNYIYSLDGKRITRATLDGSVATPVVISKRAADLLARQGAPSYLFLSESNLGALYKETKLIFITRLLNTQMPFDHLDLAFDHQPPTVYRDVPQDLLKVLERVMLMADKDESRITLSCDGKKLTVATKEQELGSATDSLDLELGHAFSVFVRANSLKQVLRSMKPETIDFTDIVSGQKRMLRFKKDGCEHAMALMVG